MEMIVRGMRDEQYNHHHLGLGLSLGVAGDMGPAGDEPRRRADDSVAHVSSLPSAVPLSQQQCWNMNGAGLFPSDSDRRTMVVACHNEIPFLEGIDVNRSPAAGAETRGSCSEEDEPGASSPNSTLSSLSGKRSAPARSEHERADPGSDDEDSGAGGSRKKLRLSKDQAAVLEESFKEHNTLNPKQKAALARQLNLKPRQVEVWFQNRRARTKLKQTEVDCELLRRCCETLTDENCRLHKELLELRALKLVPPQHYMRTPPPTTLTICPSCERLVSNSAGAGEGPTRPVPSRQWGAMFPERPAQRSS
ncbi:hypothetical protein ABZP36_031256 [Zizania latifolia]